MYSLTQPTPKQIQRFITSQHSQPFSYAEVGSSQGPLPAGYRIDHHRIQLGVGAETFAQAKAAIHRWQMFQLSWLQLCWPAAPIEVGSIVGIMVQVLGIWSLNGCRIVYVIEEAGAVEKFGFAYGTLPDHAERGEERFQVEWRHADDSVWYDILAFSQPNQLPAKIIYPYARKLQKRFAADSMQAMIRAVT